ncbi:MAG: thiosulfate oxidation carrier protein SoxY [Betaproteobacteria bacterium RIFCSPLOWO2_02_FULL_62_17]|nr:MAG: thiosulfate oxidation carrier protein SoxY [Betaproteobacteria bacterium RIFCSPLOWO2_02_FULL_62_17]
MEQKRREVLKAGGGITVMALAVGAGLLRPEEAFAQAAWNKAAFETKSFADTVKALGGANAVENPGVRFASSTPDIAENGALVPITVTSSIPKTESIAILVEKNPNTLAANFNLPAGTEPFVSTRVKMGQTSDIYALVKADGRYYFAKKEVKVTIGGCGG